MFEIILELFFFLLLLSRKLLLIKRWKKSNRIKDFSKSFVNTEEYIEKLFEIFLFGVFNNIEQFNERFDLSIKYYIDKLENFLKDIIDN